MPEACSTEVVTTRSLGSIGSPLVTRFSPSVVLPVIVISAASAPIISAMHSRIRAVSATRSSCTSRVVGPRSSSSVSRSRMAFITA